MAGQEGLEPPTIGFGDRCSTIGATDLTSPPLKSQYPRKKLALQFDFFMKSVLIFPWAELFKLQFFSVSFSVLGCAVIDIFTIRTLQSYFNFHNDPLWQLFLLILFNNIAHNTSANGPTAFTNRKFSSQF